MAIIASHWFLVSGKFVYMQIINLYQNYLLVSTISINYRLYE
jgi:hypothetical protein